MGCSKWDHCADFARSESGGFARTGSLAVLKAIFGMVCSVSDAPIRIIHLSAGIKPNTELCDNIRPTSDLTVT
ncbi:unnamed protein product [Anisakis simplex]|uniref:Uncharacterized protein n=1 Tax=Anisakis simplex TaxID=6269 RepID=A0A0M3KAR2_ANISI|nr:unnamed protein product [Anisakis simplex]